MLLYYISITVTKYCFIVLQIKSRIVKGAEYEV